MNTSSIQSLRQKFERRINSLKEADFESLSQLLAQFWVFFNKEPILLQIRENLTNQFPNLSEKVYQVFHSPSNRSKDESEKESVAIAFEVLFSLSETEKNSFRGKLQASVSPTVFGVGEFKNQAEIDERYTRVFKSVYLDKFYYYVEEQLEEIESQKPPVEPSKNMQVQNSIGKIFIGHGRSAVWRDLKDFLQDRLRLDWDEFNRESVAGIATTERLETMLNNASFAFLIMTAEDAHADETLHARENVIHEIGLFQGRLGFRKAIILFEEGCQEFSNIFGLTQIRFPKGNIEAKFEEIRKVLERESISAHNPTSPTKAINSDAKLARKTNQIERDFEEIRANILLTSIEPVLREELKKLKAFIHRNSNLLNRDDVKTFYNTFIKSKEIHLEFGASLDFTQNEFNQMKQQLIQINL